MDAEFWHKKWEKNEIGFHQSETNPILKTHFDALSLNKGSRIFVPLCGKTLDISWLLSKGYRIAGAELNQMAIEQLFAGLELTPNISNIANLKHYSAKNIDIFVGDLFDVSKTTLGPVDAVYDRAALVALPEELRKRYAAHLTQITDTAPQLLVSYRYDQSLMDGPPFSVSDEEVDRHYGDRYEITRLASIDLPGGIKGKCAATENVWHLQNTKS